MKQINFSLENMMISVLPLMLRECKGIFLSSPQAKSIEHKWNLTTVSVI